MIPRIVIVFLISIFCALCVRPAHSAAAFPDFIPAGQPVPSPQPLNVYSDKSVYYEYQADGSAKARIGYPPSMQFLNGAPELTATNSVANTANPEGFVSKVNASGAAVLESTSTLKIAAPAGAVPSAAVSTSASAMAGAGVEAATLVKTVPLGAGAGSLAAKIGKGALGIGAAGAAFLGSPVLLGALMTASVGMAGYDFYQSLKAQGVTLNADGSALKLGSSQLWFIGATGNVGYPGVTAFDSCRAWSGSVSVVFTSVTSTSGTCSYLGTTMPVVLVNVAPTSSTATNDQVQAAVDSATLDQHIASDLAAVALLRNIPLPIPNGYPALTSTLTDVKSPFAETKKSTDSLGNTTSTLERNVASVSPAVNGVPPKLDMRRESVVVVNAAPQTVTSTSLAPTIANNVATAAAQQQATKDLCVDHPDILACSNLAVLNDVPDTAMLKKDVSVAITPVALPQSFICPAGVTHKSILGPVQYWDIWGPACGFAPFMKPIVLAFAWVTAGLIVFVGRPYQS